MNRIPMPTILDEFSLPKAGTFNKVEFEPSVDQGLGESILKILKSFNIEGKIVGTETGPIVTSVYFAPASGVRVSSVEERADDLQIRLGVPSLKISMAAEKRAVAIEIPNTKPCKIQFGNVFHSDCSHMQLPAALGVDTKGNSVYLDITKTPHMLIAGQTGSGKSVCLNSIIVSLALNCRPADLQFLLIDPKRVEFFPYEKMHNLVSGHVIKDVDEALQSLMWLVQEMEARNVILEKCRCRNIKDFKRKLNLGQIEDMPIPFTQDMPYIVAVVDEYADLMMRSPKELVDCIMKLAQKARNVGIHLILATQRPSTKIISGDIKANIPARIALKTATAVDSSTILGFGGAEKLLGKGDMLLSTDGPVKRIHGCYISDEEIEKAISLLPTRDMFHFNRKDLFLTDFELFWNERFKERPTWGEINAVSKAALEHINDYLENKEIEVNQGIAKEELTNIWQELEKAVKNEELCELIAKRFLPQTPIAESEFTKLVIYTNFYFKDSEAIHPFMKFILEKAVKESDKTALMTVKHFSSSACYDRNILQKEIKTMCDNNEMSKEFIYEHFADFKSVIVDWAKEGDEKAETILFENYKDFVKHNSNFDNSIVTIVDKKIKTGNYDEKIIDIVYEYFETFNTTIVDWVKNGDKRAQNFFLENYKQILHLNDYTTNPLSYDSDEDYFTFTGLSDSVIEDALIICTKDGDERAKDIVYSYPLSYNFIDILFKWAGNNDERAQKIIIDCYENPKPKNKTVALFFSETIIVPTVPKRNPKIDDFASIFVRHAAHNIYDKSLDRKPNIWAINFVCSHLDIFKQSIINLFEKASSWSYNIVAHFVNSIIQLANEDNNDAFEIAQYLTGKEIFSNYLQTGDKNIIKQFLIYKYWPRNSPCKANCIYFIQNEGKDTIITWAKKVPEAIEFIYAEYYDFRKKINVNEFVIEFAKNGNNTAIEIVCENNKKEEFEDCLIELIKQGNKTAIYKCRSNIKFKDCLIKLAMQGNETAKSAIYDLFKRYFFIKDNYDFDENDKNEFTNCYDFAMVVTHWALNGKNDDCAKTIIYEHYKTFDFEKILVKMALTGDHKAREVIYKHELSFKDCIVELANTDERAKEIVRKNSYNIWRDLRSTKKFVDLFFPQK